MHRQSASQRQAGLTLIEVLVVLVIISIVAAGVTLTVGHNRSWSQKVFVEELSEVLTLAQEYAMLQPATIQVSLRDRALYFQEWRVDSKSGKGAWVPVETSSLQSLAIPSDYAVRMDVHVKQSENDEQDHRMPIVMSMNGDWTPFDLWVGLITESPQYRITGLPGGAMTVTNVDEAANT